MHSFVNSFVNSREELFKHATAIKPWRQGRPLRRAQQGCLLLIAPTLGWTQAAFIDGDASYLQRILPPARALLVVTLEDTSRADGPAVELARTQMRLAGGPPYSWRLGYDTGLVTAQQRVVVRGRILFADALWISTDEATPAFDKGPISLRWLMAQSPPVAPVVCAAAATQGEMTQCAFDEFLQASSAYAASHAALAKRQPQRQLQRQPQRPRAKLLRMQSTWLNYRTAACEFESSAVDGGSLKPFVNWRCAARLTRARAAEVGRLASCGEGDAACAGPRQ